MKTRELTCIGCPLGCAVAVEMGEDGQITSVTGNTCKRGGDYARKEVTNPTRIVTSTVKVEGGMLDMVSVKTKSDIPKDKIFACVEGLKGICVKAPVHIGDTIVENIAGTGVDVVATKEAGVSNVTVRFAPSGE
ncbi:MAG: DUF1667 domain-containing protein [Ruminococcus sp.]|jgi:CxxC motif-containing protein|nr:DUF1667 domain-containing protein [Ruminococcus sp.]